MLNSVRKSALFATILLLAAALAALAKAGDAAKWPKAQSRPIAQRQAGRSTSSLPPTQQSQQQQAAQRQPQRNPKSAQPALSLSRMLTTVVLDPAHGGTDEGAHGSNGIIEKNVTLALAQVVQTQLLLSGLNVVMTRQTDKTLSFAQRSAIANAQHNAVFITLDVGSTGQVGTAYAYYYDFFRESDLTPPSVAGGMLSWDQAQRPWQKYSRRLAQLLQVEFSARLIGSPELPSPAEVYQLRSINEPAVAIEVENVNTSNESTLTALGQPLATSISHAIQAFRTVYQAEVH